MIIGIQVVKATSFRQVQQEFANVYYYESETAITAPAQTLLDELVAAEKNFHSTLVTYLRGSVWSAGGTPAQNQMLFQKALTGTGANAPGTTFDPERAILVSWPAGFDSRGRPVKLRKWYHTRGPIAGLTISATAFQDQSSPFIDSQRSQIAAAVDAVTQLGVLETWDLCGPTGRNRTGGPEAHKWLEHHQLGDMWR